jgi:hypothetical protein
MPFLAITRAGVKLVIEHLEGKFPVWLGAEVLSHGEIAILRRRGFDVSVFSYAVQTPEDIECAVSTLREHHPDQPVWVEARQDGSNPRSADVGQAFLWREYIVGVAHEHNAFVEVCAGNHMGQRGSLVALLEATPDPEYLVELEAGQDVRLSQSVLRCADA